MDAFAVSPVGHSTLKLPAFGLGCGTLGDPDEVTSEAQAEATLRAAWERGVRYFDTAPWYGNTKSEHRVGHFLRQMPREDFAISTKVGRVYRRPDDLQAFQSSPWKQRWTGGLEFDLAFDYSRDGILRSYEDSLQRLGLNRVDALVIHDLDPRHQKSEDGVQAGLTALDAGGGYAVLADLKRAGEIKAIGAGVNHVGMIPRFLERFEIDYFLIAMPYTLLDQDALAVELPLCEARGVSVVIGAVFASGVLATGMQSGAQYAYKPVEPGVAKRVSDIAAVCARHGVSLASAALQFPAAHPAVASVIPGANAPEQVQANLDAFAAETPTTIWQELKERNLLPAGAAVPQ